MCNATSEAGAAMDAEVRALRADIAELNAELIQYIDISIALERDRDQCARERDVYKAERDTLAAQVKRAEAMIQLIDRHVGGADQTCDEPGISISEAARRTLRDQGHPLFQEDAANA